jgi:hypothetical protein
MDATFGHYINYTNIPNTTPNADPCFAENLPDDFEGHGQLIQSLMANEEFHSLYVNRYADMNNSFFTCDYMNALLDSLLDRIAPEMPAQIQKWGGTMTEWQNNVQQLRDFINSRCTVIDDGIEDCYDVVGPYPVTVKIEPQNMANQVRVNTFVPASFPFTGDYFVGTTLDFTALPAQGWAFDHWEVMNNPISPNALAENMQLSLTGTTGDMVTAVFRLAVPCADANQFVFDSTLSSINVAWEAPSNTISYEFGYRKSNSGEDWNTFSLTDPAYTIYGLDICTDYDVRVRTICDFAVGGYVEYTVRTSCLTGAEEATAGIYEWNVFPNPFNDFLRVDMVLSEPSDIGVDIIDMTGRVVQRTVFGQIGAGKQYVSMDGFSRLTAGTYLVKLTSNEGQSWKLVSKQ